VGGPINPDSDVLNPSDEAGVLEILDHVIGIAHAFAPVIGRVIGHTIVAIDPSLVIDKRVADVVSVVAQSLDAVVSLAVGGGYVTDARARAWLPLITATGVAAGHCLAVMVNG
jgi:hypothetical protein